MKVKKAGLYLLIFILSAGLQAQIKISGKVIDGFQCLSGVNLAVLKQDSAYVASTVSDSLGNYTIKNISAGSYRIFFSSVGYHKKEVSIRVDSENLQLDDVIMEMESIEMEAVSVTAKRAAFKIESGKTTVDLAAFSLGSDGSVLNTIGKIPGILIMNDGTVLLNGQPGANVMIDGKLTHLTGENLVNLLRSMPSSAVDKIEMVSHASSEYDAAGTGGFINIKRKRKSAERMHLNLLSNAEAGRRFRQNQNLSFQIQKDKYTLYTNYSFYSGQDFIWINSSREYLKKSSDVDDARLDMRADRTFSSNSHYFKTGLDYELSEKLSISADVYSNWFRKNKNETALSEFFQGSSWKDFSLRTENDQYSHHRKLGAGIGLFYKFSTKLKWENEFNILAFEQKEKLDQKSMMDKFPHPSSEDLLKGKMGGNIQIANLQSSIGYKMSDKFTFQSGIKSSCVRIDNIALYNSLQSGVWLEDKKLSSSFLYKEHVLGVYLQSGQKWSPHFSTEMGIRLELTDTEARYALASRDSVLIRSYGQLFPTFSASYSLQQGHRVSLQYGRRIVRPNYRDLNPFTEVNDSYLQERGNTSLNAELVNNLEASWLVKSKYVFSMFYTIRKNPITKSYLTEPDSDATIVMPLNLKDSYALGLRVSLNSIKPINWWTLHFNGSISYKEFYWLEAGSFYSNNLLSPTIQINNQFILPHDWALEATGYYSGTMAEGQARIGSLGSVSIGARKSFFENKLGLYLYINDVFLTNLQNITLRNSVIAGAYQERRDTRMAGITLSWKFNSQNPSKAIRKTENTEESKRINL
jgi:vitamin B12 transporter